MALWPDSTKGKPTVAVGEGGACEIGRAAGNNCIQTRSLKPWGCLLFSVGLSLISEVQVNHVSVF